MCCYKLQVWLLVCVCKNSQNSKPKRKFHQPLTKEKISPTLNQRENFPNPKLKEKISLTLTLTLKANPNPQGLGFITILTLTLIPKDEGLLPF